MITEEAISLINEALLIPKDYNGIITNGWKLVIDGNVVCGLCNSSIKPTSKEIDGHIVWTNMCSCFLNESKEADNKANVYAKNIIQAYKDIESNMNFIKDKMLNDFKKQYKKKIEDRDKYLNELDDVILNLKSV